jgi:anti-sigma B factor antagonist
LSIPERAKEQILRRFALVLLNGAEVRMSIIRTHEIGEIMVVDISGRLSILDRQISEAVQHLLTAGHRQFILKMSDVSFIDSCGLGELVCIYTSVRNSGGDVRLLAPSQRVRQLLNTTKLDTIFEILEDGAPFSMSPAGVNTGPDSLKVSTSA